VLESTDEQNLYTVRRYIAGSLFSLLPFDQVWVLKYDDYLRSY
jgi:hypothetical protein